MFMTAHSKSTENSDIAYTIYVLGRCLSSSLGLGRLEQAKAFFETKVFILSLKKARPSYVVHPKDLPG